MSELPPALPVTQLAAEKAAKRDKHRFIKIFWDGHSCICEPHEVADMLDGCDGAKVTEVWMTQEAFEALPDFGGW